MSSQPLFYWQEKLAKTDPHEMSLIFAFSAAKTIAPVLQGLPVLTTFDALSTQSQIDTFLGTTNEFLLAAFDATAMGTDAFACIINMGTTSQSSTAVGAQAYAACDFTATIYSGTGNATVYACGAQSAATLTASTLQTSIAVGAYGNLAFKCSFSQAGAVDALTAGLMVCKVRWVSK